MQLTRCAVFSRAACGGKMIVYVAVAQARPCHCNINNYRELRSGEESEKLAHRVN
jgi:hypothetical protein